MSELISRQAAIDAILHNQEVYSNNFGDDPIDKYTTAIISNDVQTIVQLPSAQQWIPCSERLPSEDGRYLVSYWLMKDMPWISVMYYGKPTFPETDHPCFYVSDGEYGDVEYDDIVAWMPLPDCYQGGEK